MTQTRRYVSPKREAQAAATREAILRAFVEQVSDPECERLSPADAAERAGVSLRTVYTHFPNSDSQIAAVGEWFDRVFFPDGVELASGPDDLPRYFRDIHTMGLASPLTRMLVNSGSPAWKEIRQQRRAERLDAIRAAVRAIGAPRRATENATAMLLSLSGADASWPMHDLYGLPIDRIPDVIANTVGLIVDHLRALAACDGRSASRPPPATAPKASRSSRRVQQRQ